jgi:hypothetical protein
MARESESGGRRGRTVRNLNLKGVRLDMKVDSSSSSFKLLGKPEFRST